MNSKVRFAPALTINCALPPVLLFANDVTPFVVMVASPAVLEFVKNSLKLFAIVAVPAELVPAKVTVPLLVIVVAARPVLVPAVLLLVNTKLPKGETVICTGMPAKLEMPAPENVRLLKGRRLNE